jgi:hypothetical protein
VDEGGVEGDSVHVQCHRGELDTEGQVMPFAVTHLARKEGHEDTIGQEVKKQLNTWVVYTK